MASDMMMGGPGGEDTEKYSDKGESLDCSDQDERKFSEESGGDGRQKWDRQTDRYTSGNSDRDSVYGSIVHVDTTICLSRSSLLRETVCPKYKSSVSKHVQTPKVTWGSLLYNCLSFCTQNLLRRTATRVYIIQEVNTHVHSLSTEYSVCFSTQLGLRVPAGVSDATTRVRINAGGSCPVQTRLQSTGSTQHELQVLDHTVYRAHESVRSP